MVLCPMYWWGWEIRIVNRFGNKSLNILPSHHFLYFIKRLSPTTNAHQLVPNIPPLSLSHALSADLVLLHSSSWRRRGTSPTNNNSAVEHDMMDAHAGWVPRGKGEREVEGRKKRILSDTESPSTHLCTFVPTISKCDSKPVRLNYPHLLNLSFVGIRSAYTHSYVLSPVWCTYIIRRRFTLKKYSSAYLDIIHTRVERFIIFFTYEYAKTSETADNGIALTGTWYYEQMRWMKRREGTHKMDLSFRYSTYFVERESNRNTQSLL